MSVQFKQSLTVVNEKTLASYGHIVFVLPQDKPSNKFANWPFVTHLQAKLKRCKLHYADLAKNPVVGDLPHATMAAWVVWDAQHTPFQRHSLLRKAIQPLLDEKPQRIAIVILLDDAMRQQGACDAVYVTAVNAALLPQRKSKPAKTSALSAISVYGWHQQDAYADIMAQVAGNTLARSLTLLPPNELTPALYREKVAKLAKQQAWKYQEYDMKKLKKIGAGAFLAVAQGSQAQDAAIVHLSYQPKHAQKHIALVGKGICFDTGGHNLKSAKYMQGMHQDMNGSAVALGVLLAASQMELPIKIDCWFAIAQNHIGPLAYKQNDVIRALNGKTIEIVHTDAEGRMVLADTLTLASRERPDWILDFATLTGSMVGALGDRYSGILGNRPELLCKAVGVGNAVGERVSAFPFDEDYEDDLASSIADIKQCTLESEADHILAARFLYQFIEHAEQISWLHMDLSAYTKKGGLGAVTSEVNGFGVAWALGLLKNCLQN